MAKNAHILKLIEFLKAEREYCRRYAEEIRGCEKEKVYRGRVEEFTTWIELLEEEKTPGLPAGWTESPDLVMDTAVIDPPATGQLPTSISCERCSRQIDRIIQVGLEKFGGLFCPHCRLVQPNIGFCSMLVSSAGDLCGQRGRMIGVGGTRFRPVYRCPNHDPNIERKKKE